MPVPPYLVDGPRTRKDLAQYYHEVSRTDYHAGLLVRELKRQCIAEDTYVFLKPRPRQELYHVGRDSLQLHNFSTMKDMSPFSPRKLVGFSIACLLAFGACTEEQASTDTQNKEQQSVQQRSVQKDSSVTPTSSITAQQLVRASLKGNQKTVRRAVKQGVSVNATNKQGKTPLMVSAFNGHQDIVRFLLENGARVEARDPQGRTALMFAATGPFPETVELLLKSEADPNATDKVEGWSPLMFAAAEGNRKVVQTLLEHGADPSIKDRDGDTALTFAKKGNHTGVVDLLQQE